MIYIIFGDSMKIKQYINNFHTFITYGAYGIKIKIIIIIKTNVVYVWNHSESWHYQKAG